MIYPVFRSSKLSGSTLKLTTKPKQTQTTTIKTTYTIPEQKWAKLRPLMIYLVSPTHFGGSHRASFFNNMAFGFGGIQGIWG
eukprot:2367878-Amphidinium_carterae.1